jgi:predicted  nucleic acid-binding Zn-ribbon protein
MLRIRFLRLRAITAKQTFGADLRFSAGLNVLRAGNTSGKSTCLQAIMFALGLERALGPQLTIPLPYAMRERIQERENGDYQQVLESFVELEIENGRAEVLTIRRDVVGGANTKLVRTWRGPRLSLSDDRGQQRDFFVHDPGASQREDGFHYFLIRFLGWELPEVTRFDGSDCPLYIETIFPMLFVEQKRGWSAIQGPFPTFFGIQDLVRRVMEFLLDLDAGNIRRERAELRRDVAEIEQQWTRRRAELDERTGHSFRFKGVPNSPSAEFSLAGIIYLEIFDQGEWKPAATVSREIRDRISELENKEIPSTEDAAPEMERELASLKTQAGELTAVLETVQYDFSSQSAEKREIEKRISTLEVDLARNQDAQKLQNLGSDLGISLTEKRCPTCHQEVTAELLPSTSSVAMAVNENIVFLKSQIELYRTTHKNLTVTLDRTRSDYHAMNDELRQAQRRIRELREALYQPSSSPSRARIEEIIQLQAKNDRLETLQQTVDGATSELRQLADQWAQLWDRLKEISGNDFSVYDREKIDGLETTVRKLLDQYGFRSFHCDEIYLSEDNFRPLVKTRDKDDGEIVEKELGFEISASDAIRLKWAYYLGLLAIAAQKRTNHPNLVVFDEPGQQEIEPESFAAFLRRASADLGSDQQLIIATSESLANVMQAVDKTAKIVNFDGFILRPLR